MHTNGKMIAAQKLLDIRRTMAAELYFAMDIINTTLQTQRFAMAARQATELREARQILQSLKHHDEEVRQEELAWALSVTRQACESLSLPSAAATIAHIADRLGIDIGTCAIPRELDKKIGNAVKVLTHCQTQLTQMAAAS